MMRERLDSWFWGLPSEVMAGIVTASLAPWFWLGVNLWGRL